ncbi:MAG: glycosyltransferase family 4 protein [Deltaproteobacteria bacterium]|nr:glycosyltransferase family 4 protein [Deltaproteobacteria bacterium]
MTIAIESPQGDTCSLAYVGSSLIRALEANGHAPIAIPSRAFDPTTAPAAVLRAYARHRDLRRNRRLIVDRSLRYGLHHHGDSMRARTRAVLVYWDSDHMPASFARYLSAFDELFGISTFVADVMRAATGRDVGILHHGIWPDECTYAPPPDGPFRFLHLGQVDARKATDVLLRAFVAAFPAREAVRLTIKCGPGQVAAARTLHQVHARGDDRVEVIGEHVHRHDLSAYFQAAHAVVLPSRCEGFGLVGLEALAHGRTVIAHGFSGPLDYLDASDCTIVPSSGKVPAPLYPGFAREPDFDALVAALRAVAADRDAACRRGAAARARVLPSWSWVDRVGAWANPGSARHAA